MAKKSESIPKDARMACEKWRTYFKINIDEYHRMHNFVLGRQWDNDEEDMLKSFKKVPLQFNKLRTLANTLLGEQQQNTPQLEVNPQSDCDEETAQIRQIITKDIMLSTNAKRVYQSAAHQAIVGGFGAFCLGTKYKNETSFEQDVIYYSLKDATRAYWDMSAEHPNKIDGMYCGYLSRMSRTKFREIYGEDVEEDILKESGVTATKEEIALAVQPNTSTGDVFNWADDEGITINHFYKRKYVNQEIYKLSNGRGVTREELEEIIENSRNRIAQEIQMTPEQEGLMPQPDAEYVESEEDIMTLYDGDEIVRIEEKKTEKISQMIYYQIAGDYILDETEFPSKDCPVIFMDQHSYYDKSGKQICNSFLIDAVDAQRYINYLGTQAAFILKISRYDQFIGAKGNVKSLDTQQNWKDPSSVKGLLTYDETPSGNKPEQLRPPELSASLMQQYQRAIEDLYTSTGLYPTRLGQEGTEVSGKAIDARTRQGSYPTYVVFNSINEAITAGGIVLNQMIPRVYDTERVISLMTPDKGRQNIRINQQMDEYGEKIKNDLKKGEFEVMLIAGPSYEGQKAEALQSLNMILQANPSLLNLIADLYAENLPLTNTIEIKNRLKTIVPPEILEAGKTGQMPEESAQPNAQDAAAMAEVKFKQEKIELEKQKLQLEMQEAQLKTEQVQMELEMKRLEIAGEIEAQKLRYLAETDRTRSDNAIAHADNLMKLLTHTDKMRGKHANE